MATCKDCVHCDVCDMPIITDGRKNASNCKKFKNKADFVEVKHGYNAGEFNMFKCSVCGYGVDDICEEDDTNYPVWSFNYCPRCGAKMDGKEP